MRDYSGLTREELETRLDAAEDVAVLFAWSPINRGSVPACATYVAWKRWDDMSGGGSDPKRNRDLSDRMKDMARSYWDDKPAWLDRPTWARKGAES